MTEKQSQDQKSQQQAQKNPGQNQVKGQGQPQKSQGQEQKSQGKQDTSRTIAQWTTFGIAAGIILVLVGAIIYWSFTYANKPVSLIVQPQLNSVRHIGGYYYLPVELKNQGGRTAENAWVQVSLQGPNNEVETASFSVRFLAGGDTRKAEVGFKQDPAQGKLSFSVSYIHP